MTARKRPPARTKRDAGNQFQVTLLSARIRAVPKAIARRFRLATALESFLRVASVSLAILEWSFILIEADGVFPYPHYRSRSSF